MTQQQSLEVKFNPLISKWRNSHKKVDKELEQSIVDDGLITSMTARRLQDGSLEMIGGHERYKVLQKNKIPVTATDLRILENVTDIEAVLMAIAENAKRKSLNVIEEARAFKSLEELGMPHDQIAEKVGLSKATVSARIEALELPKHIQEKMQDGAIGFGFAKALLKLKDYKEAQTELANDIANNSDSSYSRYTVEKAEEQVTRFFEKINFKEKLLKQYGPCPKCEGKLISGNDHWNKDQLTCDNPECEHKWHRETKDPWEYYELKQKAEEMGLDVKWDVDGKEATLSPKDVQEILEKQKQEKEEEKEKAVQPTFRSKAPIADAAVALIKDNVMHMTVDGDKIALKLIEPSEMNFEAFKKDYQNTDDITKITVNGWGSSVATMRPKVEEFLKSLIA
uniref:ParB/Spo0J HTH domain-containing protein n=1 Tax=viral metagenome TaxID=1070528 RepID=A0A6M3J3R7_9ZZZZ